MGTLNNTNISKAIGLGMPLRLEIKDIEVFSKEEADNILNWLTTIVKRTKEESSTHKYNSGIEIIPAPAENGFKVKFFIDYWWSRRGCWTGWNDTMSGDVTKDENLERINKVVEAFIQNEEKKQECRKTNEVTEDLLKNLIKDNEHILRNPVKKSTKGYATIEHGKMVRENGNAYMCIVARYEDGSYHQRTLIKVDSKGDYYINVATPLCGEYEVHGLWNYDLLSNAVNQAFRFITCEDSF